MPGCTCLALTQLTGLLTLWGSSSRPTSRLRTARRQVRRVAASPGEAPGTDRSDRGGRHRGLVVHRFGPLPVRAAVAAGPDAAMTNRRLDVLLGGRPGERSLRSAGHRPAGPARRRRAGRERLDIVDIQQPMPGGRLVAGEFADRHCVPLVTLLGCANDAGLRPSAWLGPLISRPRNRAGDVLGPGRGRPSALASPPESRERSAPGRRGIGRAYYAAAATMSGPLRRFTVIVNVRTSR
jgi:hypothetical protein